MQTINKRGGKDKVDLKKGQIPTVFDTISLSIASPEQILDWSYGEVTKPETINYRTQKPERDGLFCEKIFGPSKNWECYCGKYKKLKHKNIICDKCGVEVTRSSVRRERMGHIKLAVPVTHIWFLRSTPSKIGALLNLPIKSLERVVYFAGYIIKDVDEVARKEALKDITKDFETEKKEIQDEYQQKRNEAADKKGKAFDKMQTEYAEQIKDLEETFQKTITDLKELEQFQIISELQYREFSMRFGHCFTAGIGAEALRDTIQKLDLEKLKEELHHQLKTTTGQKRIKVTKRLVLVSQLLEAGIKPEWMVITSLPVIPPDLRPMVQLDGGRFATSDLNDLYRRVINRNNRLKRLLDIGAPEVICRNEKRMLQEAVDALINNSARAGKAITKAGAGRLQLKSLSDMLKGKQGRFRQNLLGKRVDYSGRSVIVVGPNLKLNQCGLPKKMALELFKPFIIQRLIAEGLAYNIKNAEKLIEWGRPEVWDKLEEITKDHYVLLNRAPTLHRLGIQAFQPVLIEGKAIQIHPLVCAAFNADFDGDQMAVHVPLSKQAQWEAKHIMSATKNLLKPSEGRPITTPSQDMVLGCYTLTYLSPKAKDTGFVAVNVHEAVTAYRTGKIKLNDLIKTRVDGEIIETTAGRMIFNSFLPEDLGYYNENMNKNKLKKLVTECFETCGLDVTTEVVDQIKRIGFKFATKSGVSIAISDIPTPSKKLNKLDSASEDLKNLTKHYRHGFLTDEERYGLTVNLWSKVKNDLSGDIKDETPTDGPIFTMIDSGARGNWGQLTQMGAMVGIVSSPSGKPIELPIKSSYKEGLATLEYFIATHGGRKGKSDTALKTAGAGYLTRRLVDAVQDVIVRIEDCKTKEFHTLYRDKLDDSGSEFENKIFGRITSEEIKLKDKTVIKKGTELGTKEVEAIIADGISEINVRSVLYCKAQDGVCIQCYGRDLGTNESVEIGTAIGIIAAQSIGEPGTQLTMRTFHMGGIAEGKDITQGLPRVEELFEARSPKSEAVMTEIAGKVKVSRSKDNITILVEGTEKAVEEHLLIEGLEATVKKGDRVEASTVIAKIPDGKMNIKASAKGTIDLEKGKVILKHAQTQDKEYVVSSRESVLVKTGDVVKAGDLLTEGHLNLQKLTEVTSPENTMRYIVSEVENIYVSQGQTINEKHIEVIVRQMFSRARILDAGGSDLITGQTYDYRMLMTKNEELKKEKKPQIAFERLILGLIRVSLTTDSWLSAASFQETIRALVRAATTKKIDYLHGLKENVIIGKLIPAGIVYKKMYEQKLIGESKAEEVDITDGQMGEVPAPSDEMVEIPEI